MGFYTVGWYREKISKYRHWNDYDWDWNDDKYFNIQAPIVNRQFLETLPEYKYSAINKYEYPDILKYLRFYEQYPHTELLVKAGLSFLATSKMILKKCLKDKKFCKWLYKNKDNIKIEHYTSSILSAYRRNLPVEQVYSFDRFKKYFEKDGNFNTLKQMFTGDERKQFLQYLIKQKTDGYSYNDYLEACIYLNLDMTLDKNRYPHNFKQWHDIRIDEYHSAKAKADEKARKKLYKQFGKVAKKYIGLENTKNDFVIIIAKSPADLIKEGEILHHCVGRMGYDQKFAREETLIFFVRNKDAIETPFVTLEYSLKNHKILQCYADNDTKPTEQVLEFVNNKWLPYANKKIRKIA